MILKNTLSDLSRFHILPVREKLALGRFEPNLRTEPVRFGPWAALGIPGAELGIVVPLVKTESFVF